MAHNGDRPSRTADVAHHGQEPCRRGDRRNHRSSRPPGPHREVRRRRHLRHQAVQVPDAQGAAGEFTSGPLAGRSVSVRNYSTDQGVLDIRLDALPDFFLVLTGRGRPRRHPAAPPSRGPSNRPTCSRRPRSSSSSVARGVKIGVATSVRRHIWDDAEIYPSPNNGTLRLTPALISMIALFGDS